jgi:hypothetical protein
LAGQKKPGGLQKRKEISEDGGLGMRQGHAHETFRQTEVEHVVGEESIGEEG